MRDADTRVLADAITRGKECERVKGRRWEADFSFLSDGAIEREICNATYKMRSGTTLKQPVVPHTIICARGDSDVLTNFFALGIKVPYTLITMESDSSVPQRPEWATLPKAWYGCNSRDPALVKPLPIGLADKSMMQAMRTARRQSPSKKKNVVLVNFKLDRPWRNALWELSAKWPFAKRVSYRGKTWGTKMSQVSWYQEFSQYKAVSCPAGLGLDTHRLWETLYLGGRPVALRNSLTSLYVLWRREEEGSQMYFSSSAVSLIVL